ncbi:MAG TPA: hypothetical protein VFH42_07705, partial [Sporolactobacillaceae bacterium]|nr:hypothetical protein [Sporolactobacillaceae bacterium]
MERVTFDYAAAAPFFEKRELDYLEGAVKAAHHALHNKT